MSIGSLGIVGSAAGVSSQAKAADVDRTREAVANQQRQVRSDALAETAAGIGRTDGENDQTNERDADGRMQYDYGLERRRQGDEESEGGAAATTPPADPSGASGSHLDLTG